MFEKETLVKWKREPLYFMDFVAIYVFDNTCEAAREQLQAQQQPEKIYREFSGTAPPSAAAAVLS